uniref:Uncharacterized protein n=1 Tax=Arundo donax TaxID=35708 RepID=A0A0A9GG03_ARUDO
MLSTMSFLPPALDTLLPLLIFPEEESPAITFLPCCVETDLFGATLPLLTREFCF